MNQKGRNVAASVQGKLLQLSRDSKLSLQDLLERYCIERLLEPEEIEFPSLLDMPKPVLRAYTKETALAEKFEAMVTLGERNSRMKDYFDVWLLSERFAFCGEPMARAIAATFARRKTEIPRDVPVGLSATFASDDGKQTQWKAFWRKVVRTQPIPDFSEVTKAAGEFLLPAAMAARRQEPWRCEWQKSGPWRARSQG